MSKIPATVCLTLALSVALSAGCMLTGPTVYKTRLPVTAGETYGEMMGLPEFVPAVPIGEDVVVPRGKAALTLYVVIPQKVSNDPALNEREVQYVDYGRTTKVEVTITGENLLSPVTTSINVSAGMSAAGTIIVTPGRNQIITAVAKDSSGNVVATVKGVATSLTGQIVDAAIRYGTTPLANVISGLSIADGPAVSAAAIAGLIDPILNPATNPTTGAVTYAKHPLYIDHASITSAINTLIAGGKAPASITIADLTSQLATTPVFGASSLTFRFKDPGGNVIALPASGQGAKPYFPYDRNNDQVPDGTLIRPHYSTSNNKDFGRIYQPRVSDPLSSLTNNWSSGSSFAIGNIPPGTYTYAWSYANWSSFYSPGAWAYEYTDHHSFSKYPWWALPLITSGTFTFASGSAAVVDIQLVDVSKPAPISASGGEFVGQIHEWYRFGTDANLIYRVNYVKKGTAEMFLVFDYQGNQIFQSSAATDSYTFGSAATNSLYVYIPQNNATVSVTTESLGPQSQYNTSIKFDQ